LEELRNLYTPALASLAALAFLYVLQLLVIDLAGMRIGHTPGMPIEGSHDHPMFRAARAHANTNENFALFIAACLGAVLLGADPLWTNRLAMAFVAARAVHMIAYWGDVRLVRSGAFTVGLAATIGLIIAAARAL